MMGTTQDNCCDQKTCADLTCADYIKRPKSNPTQPIAGSDPTVGGCCEDITGKCTGNTVSGQNVQCGTGYKEKADYSNMMGTTQDNCCDQRTCADLTCSKYNKRPK
jgi:hypothetical protein